MIVVYTTFPGLAVAKKVTRILLKEGLAKCVNILPSHSLYVWKGKLEEEREWVAIIKIRDALYKRVEARILSLHPYELPVVFSLKPGKVSKKFEEWLEK
jgi:periplasmic divalent cation tolerance protein